MRRQHLLTPWLLLLACALALAAAAPATAQLDVHAAPAIRLLSAANLGRWQGTIHDRVFARGARHLAAARLAAAYGGVYTASTGEKVTMYESPAYVPNDPANQAFVDFLAGLVHGTELSAVVVYIAPFAEVGQICGADADACYFPGNQQLVVPGENPPDGAPLEDIVAHEYGHHVANHRSNLPWMAEDWGTKRWATYMHVCSRTQQGTAFPGDEGANYMLNPGEAFAETFRQLNDDRGATGSQMPWLVVDTSFFPDPTAETLLAQDVTSPWVRTVVGGWSGTFARARAAAQRTVTPMADGTLVAQVVAPRGASIALFDASGLLLGSSTSSVTYTVCGAGPLVVRVVGRARGTYRVTVFQP